MQPSLSKPRVAVPQVDSLISSPGSRASRASKASFVFKVTFQIKMFFCEHDNKLSV